MFATNTLLSISKVKLAILGEFNVTDRVNVHVLSWNARKTTQGYHQDVIEQDCIEVRQLLGSSQASRGLLRPSTEVMIL